MHLEIIAFSHWFGDATFLLDHNQTRVRKSGRPGHKGLQEQPEGVRKGRSKGLPFFVILPIVWLDDVLCSRAKLVFCTCCSCKFACRRNSMCKISNRVAVIIYKKRGRFLFLSVGVTGFEPVTLWSQTRCANRTALHPVVVLRVQR